MDFGTIFKRAFLETKEFFGVNFGWNIKTVSIPVLFIAGTTVHWYRFGWGEFMEEFNVFISYALIPIGGYVVLLFLANLVLAPSRILYEAIGGGNPIKIEKEIIKPISYEAWDLANEFKLSEVIGFLAKGENNDWEPYHRMIKEAVESRELLLTPYSERQRRSRYSMTRFLDYKATREQLIELMNKKRLKPAFLFPEERK